MSAMDPEIICVSIAHSTVSSVADQRKHQSSASLAFVKGIHRWTVNFTQKCPVARKMFPFDDVMMRNLIHKCMPNIEFLLYFKVMDYLYDIDMSHYIRVSACEW